MFVTNSITIGNTVHDLVYAVTGSNDVDSTPSFEYVVQVQVNAAYPAAVRIGNALDGGLDVNGSNGYLLKPGQVFRITLPSPYRLGIVSAEPDVGARINVTMVER